MTAVQSQRGDAASHFSDPFLVHQHRQKRNAKGTADQGMYMIDLGCVCYEHIVLAIKHNSVTT